MPLRTEVFKLLFHLGKIGLLVDKRWINSRLRTVARKFSIGGFAFVHSLLSPVSTGGLDILKIDKNSTDF